MNFDLDLLQAMARAGITAEQIAVVAKEYASLTAEKRAEKREQNRIRQQNHRERNALSRVTERDERDTPQKEIPPRPPKEKLPPSSEPIGSGVSVTRANDLADFKAELHDLDASRLDALVKHRRAKRGQLTGHSARLFRRDAEACGFSMPEAVDTCISRNWITIKPEFLAGRQQRAHGPPNGKRMNAVEAHLSRRAGEYEHSSRTIDYRDAELLPSDKPGLPSPVVDLGKAFSRPFGSGNR